MLDATFCSHPPWTSEWNRIERRVYSYISTNWEKAALLVKLVLDTLEDGTRRKITDGETAWMKFGLTESTRSGAALSDLANRSAYFE
ncbi:MAG: hypothetical protein JRN09_03295 [Nitrososphaerota archaeon]|nr:hypothetical protein [Nitrososphaerota archaeon]